LAVIGSWRLDLLNLEVHANEAHGLTNINRLPWSILGDEVRRREVESKKVIIVEETDNLKPSC
jgi:hypothetical protein